MGHILQSLFTLSCRYTRVIGEAVQQQYISQLIFLHCDIVASANAYIMVDSANDYGGSPFLNI